MNRIKITVDKPADCETLVSILARNGYTVRQGKSKEGNKYIYYVEYWKEI